MGIVELLLIAVGLSMDAFAVAVCRGMKMQGMINYRQAYITAAFFGVFQALMPALGWMLGSGFQKYIENVDHWIAFVLLVFIGGKMIYETLKDEPEELSNTFSIKEIFVLAVATSIDALAIGVTFAFLGVSIVCSAAIIGVITFLLSLVGIALGHRFGTKFKKKAEIVGGVILILIGLKILLEHLGVISF